MSPETLFPFSGLSLVIGGLLATTGWLLFAVFDPAHQQTAGQHWLALNALVIAGGVFLGLGLPGFYARQAGKAGTLGFMGFVLLFVGTVVETVPLLWRHNLASTVFTITMVWLGILLMKQ